LDFQHPDIGDSGRIIVLDSVPVGVPQTYGTPENLHISLQKQGYRRHMEITPCRTDLQEEKDIRYLRFIIYD